MNERLKVNFELTNTDIRDIWNTPEIIERRSSFILGVLEWECENDPDNSRLERLKEIWLIKTEI